MDVPCDIMLSEVELVACLIYFKLSGQVENQLPEKIERLIRCEASAYQKLLMKRVEDNLGAIGTSKVFFCSFRNC